MNDDYDQAELREIIREYRAKYEGTLHHWLVYHQKEIVFTQCEYFGVPALKNPFDAWIYQEILYDVRPEVVVEIGSAYGGSTLFLAHMLSLLGEGVVISVDIDRSNFIAQHERILLVTGDSSSSEAVGEVRQLCEGRRVLVIHDGDHRSHSVLNDLCQYAPLVSLGSYFIVEDGIVDLFEPGVMNFHERGPLYAIHEFIRDHPGFAIDRSRERYILTYNPCGYLKRIR